MSSSLPGVLRFRSERWTRNRDRRDLTCIKCLPRRRDRKRGLLVQPDSLSQHDSWITARIVAIDECRRKRHSGLEGRTGRIGFSTCMSGQARWRAVREGTILLRSGGATSLSSNFTPSKPSLSQHAAPTPTFLDRQRLRVGSILDSCDRRLPHSLRRRPSSYSRSLLHCPLHYCLRSFV